MDEDNATAPRGTPAPSLCTLRPATPAPLDPVPPSRLDHDISDDSNTTDADDDFTTVVGKRTKKRKHPSSDEGEATDGSQATVRSMNNQTKRKEKIPPIIIDNIKNWQQFLKNLKNNGMSFEAKFVGDKIHIICDSPDKFRQLQSFLIQTNITFHTFSLSSERELKLTIKGLRHDTPVDDIKEALESDGFSPTAVTPLLRRDADLGTRSAKSNTFLVKLKKVGSWARIWKLQHLLNVRITVGDFRPQRGLPQCYNCQQYGHSSVNCHLPTKCVKCAGPHLGRNCNRQDTDPLKCSNCGGQHVASWKGCPTHAREMERRRHRDPSYRHAPNPPPARQQPSRPPQQPQTAVPPPTTLQTNASPRADPQMTDSPAR